MIFTEEGEVEAIVYGIWDGKLTVVASEPVIVFIAKLSCVHCHFVDIIDVVYQTGAQYSAAE